MKKYKMLKEHKMLNTFSEDGIQKLTEMLALQIGFFCGKNVLMTRQSR